MKRLEVVKSVRRRRSWSLEQKKAVVAETSQPGVSISSVAMKYGINYNQLYRWKKKIEKTATLSEVNELRARVQELERLLGRKTVEIENLKDSVRIIRDQKVIVSMPSLEKMMTS